MKKFNPGDLVIALRSSYCLSFVKGNIYKVKNVNEFDIGITLDEHGSKYNGWGERFFELYKPKSTIKTHLPDFL